MSNRESTLPPLITSLNVSGSGITYRPTSLNSPAHHPTAIISESLGYYHQSFKPSSFQTSMTSSPNLEHPPIWTENRFHVATSHPNTPATHQSLEWGNGVPREPCHQASSQTSSSNSLTHQNPPMAISPEMSVSVEEGASRKYSADTSRLYFAPGVSPITSHAPGISSSIELIKIDPLTDNSTDPTSFINNVRGLSSKMTAHRRVSAPQDPKPASPPRQASSLRKPLLTPISVEAPQQDWVGRRGDKRRLSYFPGQSFMSSILHIRPLSATASPDSPYSGRTLSPSLERGFYSNNLLCSTVIFIPRLIIRFLQYLVSPWAGWLSLPQSLLQNNAFGDTTGGAVKYRRKGLASSVATIYVIFCMFMFSHDISFKLGFISRGTLAYHDAQAEMIPRTTNILVWSTLFSVFISSDGKPEERAVDLEKDWSTQHALKRRPNYLRSPERLDNSSDSFAPNIATPLSSMPHTARFSKLHSKSGSHFSDQVTPLLFQGTCNFPEDAITACMYTNQFWLHKISDFVGSWDGPVSLVVESFSMDQPGLMTRIETLRKTDSLVRERVDFHIVQAPDGSPTQNLKNVDPRFFSRSELVWLVGDARVLPSPGLYGVLSQQTSLRTRVLDYGNAIVIPNFALTRERQVYPRNFLWKSVNGNLTELAEHYMDTSLSAIALPSHEWPKTREELLRLTGPSNSPNPDARFVAMYDHAWMPFEGPSNWTMWQNSIQKPDSTHGDLPEMQDQMYPIISYDLNYAPNVIISRQGQPWCTERFEFNKAACVYQMYLSGTELWVLPEAWTLTVQQIPRNTSEEDPELKELISARLYSKFHQEACMHYGREFSSLNTWEDERSRHARAISGAQNKRQRIFGTEGNVSKEVVCNGDKLGKGNKIEDHCTNETSRVAQLTCRKPHTGL
ncbi:hypothetical protein VP01_632g10 [Puccinia sorghi]|uniref:Uncharacterized protein n=1 Tax=Puccinia sorghi TaxID=27349 RepID=A0A0L6UIA7_9BASI|nr:hypothetical protein VP01_632g10 [Puccinia sorghi]